MRRHRFFCAGLCAMFCLFAGTSLASPVTTYAFYNITQNDPCDAAAGEQQLLLDVSNGDGVVEFTVRNIGPASCSITDVYFDDGSLLGIDTIVDADEGLDGQLGHPGVDFERGATPGNLPGGED